MNANMRWAELSPFLLQHGGYALSYSTLQEGLSYFINAQGYIAHVETCFGREMVFCDPVCAPENLGGILHRYQGVFPDSFFTCISENCARLLQGFGHKIIPVGYEVELPIATYNTAGDWKNFDMIKRARNKVLREGIRIQEETGDLRPEEFQALTRRWMQNKVVRDREIWLFARKPVLEPEPGVRKFLAYNRSGEVIGYVFYDPMFKGGNVRGYSATIVRCDERNYGRLSVAIHMRALEVFRSEGCEVLNLHLAPFAKLQGAPLCGDSFTRWLLQMLARFGNRFYNFKGLSFFKSKFRGQERFLYMATRRAFPFWDVLDGFKTAGII